MPSDIEEVLKVAASREACTEAAEEFGVGADTLQLAARLYLKQVLFHDHADCYRILGIDPDVSRETARRHLAWLLRWLHPDRNSGWDSAYAERVVAAWREVSRPRRGAEPEPARSEFSSRKRRPPRRATAAKRKLRPRARGIGWLLLAIAGIGIVAAGGVALIGH